MRNDTQAAASSDTPTSGGGGGGDGGSSRTSYSGPLQRTCSSMSLFADLTSTAAGCTADEDDLLADEDVEPPDGFATPKSLKHNDNLWSSAPITAADKKNLRRKFVDKFHRRRRRAGRVDSPPSAASGNSHHYFSQVAPTELFATSKLSQAHTYTWPLESNGRLSVSSSSFSLIHTPSHKQLKSASGRRAARSSTKGPFSRVRGLLSRKKRSSAATSPRVTRAISDPLSLSIAVESKSDAENFVTATHTCTHCGRSHTIHVTPHVSSSSSPTHHGGSSPSSSDTSAEHTQSTTTSDSESPHVSSGTSRGDGLSTIAEKSEEREAASASSSDMKTRSDVLDKPAKPDSDLFCGDSVAAGQEAGESECNRSRSIDPDQSDVRAVADDPLANATQYCCKNSAADSDLFPIQEGKLMLARNPLDAFPSSYRLQLRCSRFEEHLLHQWFEIDHYDPDTDPALQHGAIDMPYDVAHPEICPHCSFECVQCAHDLSSTHSHSSSSRGSGGSAPAGGSNSPSPVHSGGYVARPDYVYTLDENFSFERPRLSP